MKKMNKKTKVKLSIILTLVGISALALNPIMQTTFYNVYSEKITKSFRIALITDLHSCKYGKNQQNLINAVLHQNPDLVLFSGDIIDDDMPYDNALTVLSALGEMYPSYYVTGNHEIWTNNLSHIKSLVTNANVTVLDGSADIINVNGNMVNIAGVDDPSYMLDKQFKEQLKHAESLCQPDLFTILLSHRPEKINTYLNYNFDLILSGHAHGGQWRLPFLNEGLLAPNQGVFPDYTNGIYNFEEKNMVVSRGLARESTLVPRIFNRPELVILDINPIEK